MDEQLYQKAILDLARRASGAGKLEAPDASVALDNPVCGDRVTMDVKMDDGHVAAVAHKVRGCLLCEAAASAIGANAPGATAAEIHAAHKAVEAMLKTGAAIPAEAWPELSLFGPAAEHKSRHHCVLLPFEAIEKALAETAGT